jgi:hypothetical protein
MRKYQKKVYVIEVENCFADRLFYASLGINGHTFTSRLNGDYPVLYYVKFSRAVKAANYVASIRSRDDIAIRIMTAMQDQKNGHLTLMPVGEVQKITPGAY